mgnify:CR=1 FL=1
MPPTGGRLGSEARCAPAISVINQIGRICIYNFVIPVSGIFLAGIVLHEDIWHLRYFGALLLVTAGIIIVNKTTNNKKSNTSN